MLYNLLSTYYYRLLIYWLSQITLNNIFLWSILTMPSRGVAREGGVSWGQGGCALCRFTLSRMENDFPLEGISLEKGFPFRRDFPLEVLTHNFPLKGISLYFWSPPWGLREVGEPCRAIRRGSMSSRFIVCVHYMYMYVYVYVCVYIYIYVYRTNRSFVSPAELPVPSATCVKILVWSIAELCWALNYIEQVPDHKPGERATT